jgi:hypothetical protein
MPRLRLGALEGWYFEVRPVRLRTENMLLHIFRLEAKASLSGRRKRLVQQEPRACGDGYLHSFSHFLEDELSLETKPEFVSF